MWSKTQINLPDGRAVEAQEPIIVSASRSTDIPAFYPKWLIEKFKQGYVRWVNPFNGKPIWISFARTRLLVLWSKNPEPIIPYLPQLAEYIPNYYFLFTLNDYDKEQLEPNVPPLELRAETFIKLSERIGKDRVIWRFDPLIITDRIGVNDLLEKIERVGNLIRGCTEKLIFSFADISDYRRVMVNLQRAGIRYRDFTPEEIHRMGAGLKELGNRWGISISSCAERYNLSQYGIEPSRCVDDRLIARLFNHDTALMDFIGYGYHADGHGTKPFPGPQSHYKKIKDKGQRALCGCIKSKDIGWYNSCPHLCHYCYANRSELGVMRNYWGLGV